MLKNAILTAGDIDAFQAASPAPAPAMQMLASSNSPADAFKPGTSVPATKAIKPI
jgi:hypothetical protein